MRRLRLIVITEGLWALALYRFGQYVYREAPGPLLVMLCVPYEIAGKIMP
ncbi:MAG: hypothetical protein HY613_09145 [Candidatus Rokubacteria bacterium]|nr:hypothetical protein [Candidatus Rokubacteria bacterium]